MGSLRRFLFLILCCAVAGLASAQSISITFLNDWGEQTSHLLSEGRSLLRVVDPGADVSPGQDHVSVSVSSSITGDALTTDLVETGPATGVFEGGVTLTSDLYADYLSDSDYLLVSDGMSIPLDTATATYGSASASATVVPSLVDLLNEEDRSPASFALGETVRVRVRDLYAGIHSGQDTTVAVLSSSGGDSETLNLVETGGHTGVFEMSVPLVAGTPAAQDGQLQTAAGETLSVTHADGNPAGSSSSDSATVVPASVRFIDREGRPTGLYLEEGQVDVRVVDLAANADPGTFNTTAVTLSRSTDTETLTLRETGPNTGIFQGRMRLMSGVLTVGNGYLENLNPPATDPVSVTYGSLSDTAQVVRSTTRFVDETGDEDAASVAPGQTVRLRVETAYHFSTGELDRLQARVRSLTTGDEEILTLFETGGMTWTFEASFQPVLGTAVPGDGLLQVQPGEVLQAEHLDQNNIPRSSDQVEVVRSAVRFVGENGQPVSVLLEGDAAHVEVLDLLSAGQAPPAASIESASGAYATDLESLNLTESGTPGLFAGSMPLTSSWSQQGDGLLFTASGNYRVTARANGASAVAVAAPAVLEFLDDQGEPMTTAAAGVTLRVRVRSPGLNQSSSQAETVVMSLTADKTGDWSYLFVTETGPDTAVFEGTFPTGPAQTSPPSSVVLEVQPYDTVRIFLDMPPYGPVGRTVASLAIVPVVVELLDADGRATSTYLSNETVHLRVSEPEANLNPAGADSITAQVTTWNSSDSTFDLETVSLTETGPDTGVFTGSLATSTISYSAFPTQENGLLEAPEIMPPFREIPSVTATRSGASSRAVFVDSELRLTDAQGQDTTTFQIGSPVKVWLRRPRANTSPGIDTEGVTVRNRTGNQDQEFLPLVETGGDTGLFTGQLPVVAAPAASYDGFLGGSPGDVIDAYKSATGYYISSFDRGTLIAPPNTPPNAVDDTAATNEDTPATIPVRANDTDVNGDTLTITTVTQGTQGTVTINAGATVTYTPNADANGSDSFTYTISDGNGGTDTATVTVTINPQNDPPVAVADAATTNEDTPITISVRTNDTDVDADTLTVTAVTQGTKGAVTINAGATVTYTPNANVNGTDSFTYTISDGNGGAATATVTITITPQNDPPVAVTDAATTNEDTPVTITVRSNDTDVDGDTLTITAVTQGTKGAVTINAGTTVTYTPNANVNGTDSFTYTISDGNGGTATATVTVTITPQNDPPVAVADAATTNEDTPVTISVRANDTDPENDTLTVTAVTQGTKGAVTINAGATVTYTPNANANGSDSFTYTISDGNGGTATATVTVTITPQNDPPAAVADTATTNEDTPITISVRTNDTDVDGDTLTVTAVTQGTKGAVTINAGATVTYTPNANANGSDSFTYTISDGNGGTATASVSVTVNAVNDPPVAAPDAAATNEDTAVAIAVLANDTDVDGGPLSVSAVTQGAHGSVVSNGTNVTYTPAANWNGADSFTYTVSDGQGGTATATVSVSVAAINDAPVAAPDSGATREDVSIIIPVLANDTDIDGNPLTVTFVSIPPNGITSRQPDNTVVYLPHANFTGTETFSYTVSDGQGGTSTGQVTVQVGEALERVAVLATNSVALRTSSDVLSGDVIVNRAGAGPFLNGAELSVGGSVTAATDYDLEGDSITVASGAVIGSDVRYNQLTNNGTINGQQSSPLALPVFSALPPFLTATPGSTTINVGVNGSQTLTAGSYLDLIVERKATVTFTGGVYQFRTIQVDREAKLYFSAASEIRVQQKLSTKTLTTIGPASGATIDASSIVFYVAGLNGTSGGLAATPKAVEIGTNNVLKANLYTPNGTIWLQDSTQATGAFLGKDVDVGINVQVQLDSAFAGGQ